MAWTWGGGWLAEMGFTDFAGSTIVHSTGGWAALAGALVVGPRWGKFRKDGSVKSTPPSNIPAVTLGIFILWMGWFGFNGGSQLALAGVFDAVAMSNILVNTNLAAAAGVVTALCLSRPILGRVDLFATLNGAISGMVAITAGPNIDNSLWALLIGAVGSVLCHGGTEGSGAAQDRRRGRRGPRAPLRRDLGHAGHLYRGRRRLRDAADRRLERGRLRLLDRLAASGPRWTS